MLSYDRQQTLRVATKLSTKMTRRKLSAALVMCLATMSPYWLVLSSDNFMSISRYSLLTQKPSEIKFAHTRYWELGTELIPVYRQSAHRWLFKSSPGSRLPLLSARPVVTFPAKERHHPSTSTKLYCLVTEAHRCEHLHKVVTHLCPGENRTHNLMITSQPPYHHTAVYQKGMLNFNNRWLFLFVV